MNIQEVENLKKSLENTNERLIYAKSQIEAAKQRQAEILKEYNCSSVEQLEDLLRSKEQELQVLVNAAQKYIQDTLPVIEQVEAMTRNAY